MTVKYFTDVLFQLTPRIFPTFLLHPLTTVCPQKLKLFLNNIFHVLYWVVHDFDVEQK